MEIKSYGYYDSRTLDWKIESGWRSCHGSVSSRFGIVEFDYYHRIAFKKISPRRNPHLRMSIVLNGRIYIGTRVGELTERGLVTVARRFAKQASEATS